MPDEIFEIFEDLFERRKDKKKGKKDKGGSAEEPVAKKAEAAFIFCSSCGTKNEGVSRFCNECGELLPSQGQEPQCPNCGRPAPITAKFCNACGTKLLGGAPPVR
jgi:hypothetical protein